MLKPAGAGDASRKRVKLRSAELSSVVEGQIAEICRDLADEAKRMRKLQDQVNELRAVLRQWLGGSEAEPQQPANRGARR